MVIQQGVSSMWPICESAEHDIYSDYPENKQFWVFIDVSVNAQKMLQDNEERKRWVVRYISHCIADHQQMWFARPTLIFHTNIWLFITTILTNTVKI